MIVNRDNPVRAGGHAPARPFTAPAHRGIARIAAALLVGTSTSGNAAQSGIGPSAVHQEAVAANASQTETKAAGGRPASAIAQRSFAEQAERPAGSAEVVVTGDRLRGAVTGDVPPERSFTQLDIRAFGANEVQDLLGVIDAQVRSDRGRDDGDPVVLLNGRRVSSFAEIARIPTEAIERLEVFPEEQALRYGFRADQKVVNVVVFRRYAKTVGQLTFALPTEGGRETMGVSGNYLRIRSDARLNLSGDYSRSSILLESERDLRQGPGPDGRGAFRSLLPETERFALEATASGTVVEGVSSTINGRFADTRREDRLGLRGGASLSRLTDVRDAHLGTTLSGGASGWTWTFTGNYDRSRTNVETSDEDTASTARSVNKLIDADLLVSGTPLTLPGGPLVTTFRGGVNLRDFSGRSSVPPAGSRTDLARDGAIVRANVNLPISRSGASAPGGLSFNLDLGVERLSDAGTLRSIAYGLTWSPIRPLDVVASVTHEEGAPTVEQLGSPLIVTPNLRTFDFVRGEAVDVTQVVGGNRALRSDDRRVVGVGLTLKPWSNRDVVLSLDYLNTRVDRPVSAFPVTSSAVEAAFPERFTRDGAGRLQRVDATPLNLRRSEQEQVRWGFNLTRPLGSLPPEARNAAVRFATSDADLQRRVPAGGRVTKVAAGSPAARQVENFTSRLFLSVFHTWRTRDEIVLREGGAPLDLLDGAAIDQRGGRSRHVVEIQAGAFKRGLGVRATVNWQSATRIGDATAGSIREGLRFSSLTAVNVSLFANVGDRLGGSDAPSWARGARVSFTIANLFDELPVVRDAAGITPLPYQSAYLNPLGRTVGLNVRKLF